MNLKLECACGMKYEFAVDPVDGRMPYAISCPNCGADSTEQANQMLGGGATDVVEVFDVVDDVEEYEIETPAEVASVESVQPPAEPAVAPVEAQPEAPKRSGLTLPSQRDGGAAAPAPAPAGISPEAPKRSGLTLPSMRNSEPAAPDAAPAASPTPGAPAAPAASPTPGASPLKIGVKAREEEPAEAPAEKPEFENLAAANEEARQQRMARIKAKQEAEKKQWKKIAMVGTALSALAVMLLGVVIWYVFSGSKPKPFYAVAAESGPFGASARLLDPDRLLVLDAKGLALHDLNAGGTAWTTELKSGGDISRFFQLEVIGDHAWVFLGNSVSKVGLADGKVAATVEAKGHVSRVTASDSSILVSANAERRGYQTLTRIDLESAEAESLDVRVEESRAMRPDVGGEDNFEPTVANLTAREIRVGEIALLTNWDDFVPAGDSLAQLTVKLETPKITTVKAMKPVG